MAQDLESVNSNLCSPCFCLPLKLLPHVAALDEGKVTEASSSSTKAKLCMASVIKAATVEDTAVDCSGPVCAALNVTQALAG